MGVRPNQPADWPIYLRSLGAVAVVIALAVSTQVLVLGRQVQPLFFIVPSLIALTGGALIGRLLVLRKRLRQRTEEFRAIVDMAQEFTYLRRLDGSYDYVSPACEQLTGYSRQEFYATPNLMTHLIHPDDLDRWGRHMHQIDDNGHPESFEVRLITKSGTVKWITHICAPLFDGQGNQMGVRSTNVDVTQRMEDRERIERMALYDPLTELPNRRLLEQVIHERTAHQQQFAVLFLDLSRFKNINDSLGHSFGDSLLQKIARRLRMACPAEATLCRFGGDEFVIVHPQLKEAATATQFARTLLNEIERPLHIDNSELHVSGTIGIAFYPEDGTNTETLVRNADTAMYRAKRSGQDKISTYHADFSREAAYFISTESDLYKALQNSEFVPYYQPKVELATGRIIGLEALARWQHPERGLIPPNDFIAVAEETGQIAELGRQILDQVLDDLVRWRLLGIDVPVAINVSPRQFADQEFWQQLESGVKESGCPPGMLELEITEQVFLGDIESTSGRLNTLRASGFTIALDDFGTGYSSFGYLRRLPINTIKLDRSFISDMEVDPVNRAILRAMSGICDDLNLTLVAEGVENEMQRKELISYGCRLAQGFLFRRPLPARQIEPLLRNAVSAA